MDNLPQTPNVLAQPVPTPEQGAELGGFALVAAQAAEGPKVAPAEGIPHYGQPVTRAEVEAHEAESQQIVDAAGGGYRVGPPGPAPRPGVTMSDHMSHLRDLGYKV